MSDLRRIVLSCTPTACIALGVATYRLATLPDPLVVTTRSYDPVAHAEELYRDALRQRQTDPRVTCALCDEAIAILDSVRATSPDPAPGNDYVFEKLHQNVVQLKTMSR